MATRKPTKATREYRFKIDAYTPTTMPLGRLAEYLHDLSIMFGEDKSVHLIKIEEGSTVPVILVEKEAEPKVRERLHAIEQGEASPEVMSAATKIDKRLQSDNAKGAIVDPVGRNLFYFPGCERKAELEYGPFNQQGALVGMPIMVGGTMEYVPVHLEGKQDIYICSAKRSLAKQIAEHLFTTVLRVEGTGRWIRRPDGQWEMRSFRAKDFTPMQNASLRDTIEELRAIPAEWKQRDDPLAELALIRHETEIN